MHARCPTHFENASENIPRIWSLSRFFTRDSPPRASVFRRAHASPPPASNPQHTLNPRTPPIFFCLSRRQRFLRLHERLLRAVGIDRTMASSDAAGAPATPLPGNCLVIGGNRGLGLEIVRHLKERQSNVMATTRKTNEDLEVMSPSFPALTAQHAAGTILLCSRT